MKGRKNDFSMTFYDKEERVMFLKYVHNTESAIKWVESIGKRWTHAMVYDRRTEQKLERIINN